MRRSMLVLSSTMLLACPDNEPSGDDEVGGDEGQDAGEPGPGGPGCEENWIGIDGPPVVPAIQLPEYQPVAGAGSQGSVEFTPIGPDEVTPSEPSEAKPTGVLASPMSWEEFVEAHAKKWGSGWIVEGDLFLTDAQLHAVYDDQLAPTSSSLLDLNAGTDEVWSGPQALALTWCVGTVLPQSYANFPDAEQVQAERYDRIVRGMESAAREWERIANVNFIHLSEFDTPDSLQSGACQPGRDGILFRVRMSIGGECGGPCTGVTNSTPITELQPEWASPENPDGLERELVLSVSSATHDETMQITGRHELGHVLGFAHEHERFDLEDPEECAPLKKWRTLTPEDPFSVMGYDICAGIATNQPRLSAYDRVGAFYQYNWTRRHAVMMGDLEYDGSGRAGIAWYRPLAHEIETWTSIGLPGAVLDFDAVDRCTSGQAAPCLGDDAEHLRMRPSPLLATGDAADLDVLMLGPGGNLGDTILRNDAGVFQPSAFSIQGYAVPIVGSFGGGAEDQAILYRPGATEDELVVFGAGGGSKRLPVNGPDFSIPLVGRFRGAEASGNDILWYQPHTNAIEIWRWDGLADFGFVRTTTDAGSYDLAEQTEYVPILGDFDGDEMTDLFWYAPGTLTDWMWLSGSRANIIFFDRYAHQVEGEYRPFPGDFNGDGIHDILWYAVADELEGSVSVVWYFDENGGHDVKTFTIHGDYSPVIADFDDDACSDILWYDPAAAEGTSPVWRCVPGQLDFACDPPLQHPTQGFPIGYGGSY